MDLRDIQTRLAALGLYAGAVDGKFGPQTRTAIAALFNQQGTRLETRWPQQRLVTAAGQLICRIDGIDVGPIDGLVGPQTKHAFEVYADRASGAGDAETWRDRAESVSPPRPTPAPASAWPRQVDVPKFFGPVGGNQVMLEPPYTMRLAWDLRSKVQRISCHEKVHDPLKRVLSRVADHYGDRIGPLGLDLFGGCRAVRRMRGGPAWSMHSWGIAIDIDPERNQLRWGRDRAQLARPEYAKFIDLFEAEDAVSLGRARNYDWMHFQFARL